MIVVVTFILSIIEVFFFLLACPFVFIHISPLSSFSFPVISGVMTNFFEPFKSGQQSVGRYMNIKVYFFKTAV